MKINFTRFYFTILLFACSAAASAQSNFWQATPALSTAKTDNYIRLPKKYGTFRLDAPRMLATLNTAPKEFTALASSTPLVVSFPMPDGSFNRFKIVETSIMTPALAAKFPTIKTFGGQGIDDPFATIKIDWTELGLHAMIISQVKGSVFIDPLSRGNIADYVSYNKKDLLQGNTFIEKGVLTDHSVSRRGANANRTTAVTCVAGMLRTYRLAVACTAEYADSAVGSQQPTKAQAMSAIVTTVNRVDGVYETEVDIRMVLVGNNDKIVFTDKPTQPFKGNDDATILINESQKVIDSLIGTTNYDIGHTFSTGAGGYAAVGAVCSPTRKAQGVTGSLKPLGDAYDIDYVAHEMGHQFGANHTFNATTGNCGNGNVDIGTNAEPGSGVTIMGYAGICSASNNLQPNSIPYFHAISFDEITDYVLTGSGSSCGTSSSTGNHAPVVNAGSDYTIPKSTPFVLTGSATDPDTDPLTYSWEEVNVGGTVGNWNDPSDDAPIFRSFVPVTTPTRVFPQLSDIINNTTTIGEILPSYGRVLNFRLTARDNRAGGGGVCSDETNVTVDDKSGPFVVSNPNTATSWDVGSYATITWDVANTNVAPVNCTSVAIELSIDGGITFPITLLSSTPNDGNEEILIPNNPTTKARVRVRAIGNVFFDMSNVDFTIKSTTENGFTFNNPVPVASCTSSATGTVILTNSLNKFSTPITLSASGNPSGTTVLFSGNPINPGSSDSITIQGNLPPGIYDITITGTAGSVVKSRVIEFTIGSPIKTPVNATPVNNSTGAILLPAFSWHSSSDAKNYTLQISTASNFSSTVQNIPNILDTSYQLNTSLQSNTQYYWRVVAGNQCGLGAASSGTLFKTAAIICGDTARSTNVPIIIVDSVANTITSNLDIQNGGSIQDVDVVGLVGKHNYVSDLSMSIISPSKTAVLLFTRRCGSSHDFSLNFDDQATNQLQCPLTGGQTAKPTQPLSAFNNENSTGTWSLQVSDDFDGDGGSLDGWGLRICTFQQTALPVNWLTFTATKDPSRKVVLQWSAANELNNSYYEIERSTDGTAFADFAKIEATSRAGVQQYLFNDLKPFSGVSYYRLKQVDKDGKFTYSAIVKVQFDDTGVAYVVYPNPAVNKSTVRILSELKQLTLRLTDASGKTVYQKVVGSARPGEEFTIPVKGWSKGLYILTLVTDKGIMKEKVIVQ